MRLFEWLLLLSLFGCDGSLGAMRDGGITADAASGSDAGAADAGSMDAAVVDAGTSSDAGPGPAMDAGVDASMSVDAGWGDCTVGGAMGSCIPTSECLAPDFAPMAGFCPGPSDIQCCLPVPEPGMYTAADVIARLGSCTRIGGDYAKDYGGTENIPVCQTDSVIWWDADFDVDCDGGRGAICMSDPDYLPDTSGVDSMGRPLDASTLPFIVIPLASSRFRYADHGIRTGQVALVLYGGRMVFGIFGDAGPSSIIGEGSFAMAEALGIPSNPRTGGVDSGVHYLVFTGTGARVTRNEDHDEAVRLGQVLLDAFMTP